ncbi:hypothetical protein MalM25_24080 [Planctomycetes bacterium MalM25]|nr:hypothetical protein MalM25_24080 [Planctomycetes bacterium MalM25]
MQRMKSLALAAVAAALLVVPAQADDSHPGLVSIDWSKHVGGSEPTVTVRISPTLLRFMAAMASEAAAEATEIEGVKEIIHQLRQIRVEVYDDVDGYQLAAAAETETAGLTSLGWETVVRARDDEDHVDVMILPNGESIVGIVVVAAEEDSLAFVNVAGDFDPAVLGKHLGAIAKQASDGKIKLEDLIKVDIEEIIEEAVEEAASSQR